MFTYRIDCGKNMISYFCYHITLFRNNHDNNLLGIDCIEKLLYFSLNIMTWNSCTMFIACIVQIAFSMSYIWAITCNMPMAFTMSTAFTIAHRLQHAHRLLKNVDRLQHVHHLCHAIACVILIAACTMPITFIISITCTNPSLSLWPTHVPCQSIAPCTSSYICLFQGSIIHIYLSCKCFTLKINDLHEVVKRTLMYWKTKPERWWPTILPSITTTRSSLSL